MRFTKAAVAAIAVPPGKADHFEWDDSCPGFGIRFRGDKRTWIAQLRVNGATRRLSLGDVRRIELDAARTAARKFFAQATLGDDPIKARAEARAKAATTVGSTVELYLAAREGVLRPSSLRQTTRYLRVNFADLHPLPVASVSRRDVAVAVGEIAKGHGKIAAARARANLSAFFTWCLKEGIGGESNPVANTNNPAEDEAPRDRILNSEEIRHIWHVLPDTSFGKVVKLLLLTGCRRAEIGSLQWSEVDLDQALLKIQAKRMKGGKEHRLPLVPAAIDILRSVAPRSNNSHVFGSPLSGLTGFSQPLKELRGALAAMSYVTEDWTLHDIRRTVKSEMSELGIDPWISERILAHVRSGIEATYDWSKLIGPMRIALLKWSDRLDCILAGTDSNIVTLRA
jgi:integrase